MKAKNSLILVLSVLVLAPAAWGQSSRTAYSSMAADMDASTWTIHFGYTGDQAKFGHREQSNGTSFEALGDETSISASNFSLGISKEIFPSGIFSITLGAEGGTTMGSEQAIAGTSREIEFSEELRGNRYGGGLSANINFYAMGFKMQPFLGAKFIQAQRKTNLAYRDASQAAISIDTEVNAQQMEYSLGIRLFDPSVSLMSFIAVHYNSILSSDITSEALIGNNVATIDSGSVYEISPISATLGVGFIF